MTLGLAADVALGLALSFLLVGLVAAAAQELLAGLLGWRAEMLSRKLDQIIRDPALRWEFEEHPLIAAFRGSDGRPPSYIPPGSFAAAVLSIATAGRLAETRRACFDTICGWARDDGSPLAEVVLALARDADGDPRRLGAGLAQWYADAMDRMSGAYKRRAGLWALGLAVVLAAALNFDALRLAAGLPVGWGDGAAIGINDLPLAIVGWFVTGLGASLVSSMLFDLVGRAINLRHAGPRPVWPPHPELGVAAPVKRLDLSRAPPRASD